MNMLTQKEFAKHIGTEFYAKLEDREVKLILAEVKGYKPDPKEPSGMERFSVLFDGPPEFFLPQQSFRLQHEQMGEFDIFLVPISGDEKGFRYEAVFNYFS